MLERNLDQVLRDKASTHTIANKTDSTTFKRGMEYLKKGYVTKVTTSPKFIKGIVTNDDEDEYIVSISYNSIEAAWEADCDCPDPRPVWCKHIVAVAMTCLLRGDTVQSTGANMKNTLFEEIRDNRLKNVFSEKINAYVGEVIWALENLTPLQFQKWIEARKSQWNTSPKTIQQRDGERSRRMWF